MSTPERSTSRPTEQRNVEHLVWESCDHSVVIDGPEKSKNDSLQTLGSAGRFSAMLGSVEVSQAAGWRKLRGMASRRLARQARAVLSALGSDKHDATAHVYQSP